MFCINMLIITISILVSVAFYTILERKILGYIQIRKGPNKVGFMGILQPFSDALKLFNKNIISSEMMNLLLSTSTPAMSLFISMLMIPIISYNNHSLYDNKHNILLFFILSSLSVYFILLIGWSANSKYSHLGSIRSVAQMISYEVSFFLMILFISIISYSYSFNSISMSQHLISFFWGNMLLFIMWIITCLAETNRSPFDFAEGESELVSGFNVEYMGGWFALIFLAEYMSMIILSMITSMMFFSSLNYPTTWLILIMISILLLWVRGTYPRFRYDMLMKLSWKIFLPISILILPLTMNMTFYNL
uniref:NADH-ubiquinone oxidoreductase chain 1 n=1 Tax=Phanuelus gladstone TaxID=2059714 RepID=A0A7U0M8S2_9ARAC|nr:NADH dehydrogenase subunit 1 [Phanuelus gladstone]QQX28284.1 NADH dehydrogenase subunit 1 [Phanuelus gladstone]